MSRTTMTLAASLGLLLAGQAGAAEAKAKATQKEMTFVGEISSVNVPASQPLHRLEHRAGTTSEWTTTSDGGCRFASTARSGAVRGLEEGQMRAPSTSRDG